MSMDDAAKGLVFRGEGDDIVAIEETDECSDCFDLSVVIRVRYRGFAAVVDTWIPRAGWMAFTQALSVLEVQRRGEASVASMSPGELELTVRAVDRAGHMAIAGTVGTVMYDGEASLRFGPMGFDPSQLVAIASASRRISEWMTEGGRRSLD